VAPRRHGVAIAAAWDGAAAAWDGAAAAWGGDRGGMGWRRGGMGRRRLCRRTWRRRKPAALSQDPRRVSRFACS
jgi:hypothetical protein